MGAIRIKNEENIDKMAIEALNNVQQGFTIGLGSGFAVSRFVKVLSQFVLENGIKISIIPSSLQIQRFAENFGLNIGSFNSIPAIDLVIDGTDQIDKKFNMIKGGGGALLREKILIRAANKVVILATEDKFVEVLSNKVPIEVLPFARNFILKQIEKLGGKPKLRMLKKGYPIFTENGNIIFDVDFGFIDDPNNLLNDLKKIPGIIETGIFIERIHLIYKACKDKSIKKILP